MLGGAVNVAAGVAYAVVLGLSLGDGRPAGVARPIVAMVRAEASKILVIVAGLVLVLTTYTGIVHVAFFATFAMTVIVFGMAILVWEPGRQVHGRGSVLTPTEYIQHHLTFLAKPVGEGGGFWTCTSTRRDDAHPRRRRSSASSGWSRARRPPGVPSKRQAFVELCVDFVNDQVKGIYHGESPWSRRSR